MQTNSFSALALREPVTRALIEEGYQNATPIQAAAIPDLLAGRDMIATAQTGTGKTAAFALPILERLMDSRPERYEGIRALILSPTRELALQIEDSFKRYGRYLPMSTAAVLGGVSIMSQQRAIQKRPDILVATPGRLLDLLQQRCLKLDRVEILVLDEADRMLDMGFLPDVRRIVAQIPQQRQSALFSATMSKTILDLATSMMRNPVKIEIARPASISNSIDQRVLFVDDADKRDLITEVLRDQSMRRVLVFTRTKHRANRLSRLLTDNGIRSDAIHSNKTQNARQRALAEFAGGNLRALVATDIVARGIDVEGITHVINYEMPEDPENYVHRIGRTARAGEVGIALSLCSADEIAYLQGIEQLTQCALTEVESHPYRSDFVAAMRGRKAVPMRRPSRNQQTSFRRRSSGQGNTRAQRVN